MSFTTPANWAEVIALFGTGPEFAAVMAKYGDPLVRQTPAAWAARGVPPHRWGQLVAALKSIGREDLGWDFLEDLRCQHKVAS